MTRISLRAAGTAAHPHEELRFNCLCCPTMKLEQVPGMASNNSQTFENVSKEQPILTEAGALTSRQRTSLKCQNSRQVEVLVFYYLVAGMGEHAAKWLAEDTACIMTSGHFTCVLQHTDSRISAIDDINLNPRLMKSSIPADGGLHLLCRPQRSCGTSWLASLAHTGPDCRTGT